ncbi:MAG: sigma-70 family RNA polymerase sigma factor [Alphaproteobacteria bacterium]
MRDDLQQEACRHIAVMKRYAVALSRDPVRAEDLVQDALARALAGIAGFRRGSPMLPWLLRILHNVYVSDRRRRPEDPASLDDHENHAAEAPVAEERVQGSQLLRLLWTLPDDQRAAVTLVCLDELSYAQAADVLGIPKGTLMSRLARGRAALRALVEADTSDIGRGKLRVIGGSRS